MRVRPNVVLIEYTPNPDSVVAAAGRLCYSNADIDALRTRVSEKDQTKYLTMLRKLGHLSTFEHVSFTFGIEGVSRALLAQITRHRIASFSVQSRAMSARVVRTALTTYCRPKSKSWATNT